MYRLTNQKPSYMKFISVTFLRVREKELTTSPSVRKDAFWRTFAIACSVLSVMQLKKWSLSYQLRVLLRFKKRTKKKRPSWQNDNNRQFDMLVLWVRIAASEDC